MTDQIITEVQVLPDGCPRSHMEARVFAVTVTYRGTYERRSAEGMGEVDWYSVEHCGSSLSRAGNWVWMIERFQRWQYRFTYDEAIAKAHAEVNGLKVNGRTWAEWEASRGLARKASV